MDTQTLITTASICAVVFMLLVSVLPGMLRGIIANKAQNQFMAGDFDAVLKTLSGPMASFCLPKYNQEYMRLNAYEAKQDVEGVQRTLDVMLGLRATAQQRRILLSRALNFYETQGDEERATHVLELIDSHVAECKGEALDAAKELKRDSRQTFNIAFRGSYAYIAEMEHDLASADADERARLNYYLSLQYGNKGDEKRAREYLDRIAKSYGLVPNDKDDEAPTEDAGEGVGDDWHEEDGARRR